jgi:hypothetical protein
MYSSFYDFLNYGKPEIFNISHYTVTAHCQKYEHRKAYISRTITDGIKFQQIHVPYALG